jgi:hypothetical protein
MDTEHETWRVKVWLGVGLLFLVSAYFSWRELKYLVLGGEADAKVVRVYETTERGRRGRTYEKLAVQYQFSDGGGASRTETDTIAASAPRPSGPTVRVQYLNGSPGKSRLAGNTQRFWLLPFFGTLGFMGFKFWQLAREAKR